MTYMLIIVDEDMPDIITEHVRIDFVKVGTVVHGRQWRGQRINVVINRSSHRLDKPEDENTTKWWEHVKRGLAPNAEVYLRKAHEPSN